jgi:tellurite resistance protein
MVGMTGISNGSGLPLIPASFFGIVLGLAGLSNAWRAAERAWGLPGVIADALFAIALLAWILISILYSAKWFVAAEAARGEADHPVQCCFIGLGGVATLLVAQGMLSHSRPLATALCFLGAGATLAFALWRTGILWRGGREPDSTTAVLYLPTVAGGFVTGTVVSALGWQEWGQLAFGAGFFSWLAIESVLLHRLYTGAPLAPGLRPTLGIQLAPPAVGAVSYLSVGGGQADLFAHALLGYGLLQALLLVRMGRWIAEQPFSAAYWAFTFGATALAGAAIRIGSHGGALATVAPWVFAAANLVVVSIAIGTVRLLLKRRLIPMPVAAAR